VLWQAWLILCRSDKHFCIAQTLKYSFLTDYLHALKQRWAYFLTGDGNAQQPEYLPGS